MKSNPLHRREMIERCITRGLLLGGAAMSQTQLFALWQQAEASALQPTPTEVLGPFFKKDAPNEKNLRKPGAPGFPLRVSGKVFNTRGERVQGAQVDVWQADHQGRYDVQGYSYRAKLVVESNSEYGVETIMPGHYSDRPAQHIHYMISAPGHRPLITQIYFATDPWFEGNPDKNYGKRGLVGNRELVRPVSLFEEGTPRATVNFDIVMEKA